MENKTKKGFLSLKSVGAAVLAILLVLIFLSRTIYNYNMPVVTAVAPKKGVLSKIELTTGVVRYEDISELYSEAGGRIDAILIRAGDSVSKGQPIIEMSFKESEDSIIEQRDAYTEDAEKRLTDFKTNRDKMQVDIDKLNANADNIRRKIEELNAEVYKTDSVSDYDLRQCENDIAIAEEELRKAATLHDSGVISRQELTNAQNTLNTLISRYDNLKRVMDEAIAKNTDSVADKEESRQKQVKDYEYQLETYEKDLESKMLDLNANIAQETALRVEMSAKLKDYGDKLAEYEGYAVIYAPEDSFVISVAVNKGQYINAHQQLASFGLTEVYTVDCEVPLNNNFIVAGDTCDLYNSSHSIEGVVTKITLTERAKQVTIAIQSDEVTAGETFDISFEKAGKESYTLVPNGAVNMDSDGYFLYQIKRRNGILGKEFYSVKLRVYIGDSDSDNTIIVKGIDFFEPIVLVSDKPFVEDETIKLKNESDFFEK